MSDHSLLERFQRASAVHFAEPLCGRFSIREISEASEWQAIYERIRNETAPERGLDETQVSTAQERLRYAELEALWVTRFVHRLAFCDAGEIVGCYWGQQEAAPLRYCMAFTGIRPAFQHQGIYSAFLPRLLAACRDVGFEQVWSLHKANNNAVLVPKLRAGFVISAFEISPHYGVLVHLRAYLSEGLRAAHDYRIDALTKRGADRL